MLSGESLVVIDLQVMVGILERKLDLSFWVNSEGLEEDPEES